MSYTLTKQSMPTINNIEILDLTTLSIAEFREKLLSRYNYLRVKLQDVPNKIIAL